MRTHNLYSFSCEAQDAAKCQPRVSCVQNVWQTGVFISRVVKVCEQLYCKLYTEINDPASVCDRWVGKLTAYGICIAPSVDHVASVSARLVVRVEQFVRGCDMQALKAQSRA